MYPLLKILHLEDIPTDAELVERELKKGNIVFEKMVVDTKEDFVNALKEFSPDIIISDHSLPAFNSMEALKIVKNTGIKVPFILVTATVSEEFAVNVMQSGACDYILKDRLQRLPNAVLHAMDMYKLEEERQKFHDEVIKSEALMREAERLAHFGSWEIDMENKTAKWSEEARRIHGHEYEYKTEFSNEDFFDNIHPDDVTKIRKKIDDALKGSINLLKLNFRIFDKHGFIRFIISELLIKRNETGKPIRLTGFSQDITERKKADDEFRRLKERKKEEENLKKSLKQISNFVHHASHELRTPLATMLLETESALRKILTAEEAKKVLESLKEDQLKLIDLTNSLLLLSQFEGVNGEVNWPKLRIDELIYSSIETAKKTFPGINISFEFSTPPEHELYLYLCGNETLLGTVINNLIKNAYLYSDDKCVTIILEVYSGEINVHFENKGQVLKADDKEKIFLPFCRGENAKLKKGFGLGLSIVKKIMDLHSGTIKYNAIDEHINRFTIVL